MLIIAKKSLQVNKNIVDNGFLVCYYVFTRKQKGVDYMAQNVLEMVIPTDEQEEIKEFVVTLLLLPKEDRAVLLSNANALRVRREIEKAKNPGENTQIE